MIDDTLTVETATGVRQVRLRDYLNAAAQERARESERTWIKAIRHLPVDGQPFRRRFTYRGDSLWWFAELYLHKTQVILEVFRTIAALEALLDEERPRTLRVDSGNPVLRTLVKQAARARHIPYRGGSDVLAGRWRLLRMHVRAQALTTVARMSRRRRAATPAPSHPAAVAAFVHRAFWRSGRSERSAEAYIGPVLDALEQRIPGKLAFVSLGPSENFATRRWWRPLIRSAGDIAERSIESFAPPEALHDSSLVWRERHTTRRAFWSSPALRQHARIEAYDCWPLMREQLAGVALLQWPWSARAMDEAGAALDVLRPAAALTYAEAGGWGRALILEARRRGIPTVGLQHGFIYGSWLNYLHEADEMLPDPANRADVGFPRPSHTLIFDGYAQQHLERAGHFPPGALTVTGSPRLDALAATASSLTGGEIAAARAASGASPGSHLVLFVAKYSQARHVLDALAAAVAPMGDVHLVIKAHPAETPGEYATVASGRPNIRILPSSTPLAPLLRASRVVVTVNSTVALDAGVLGIPALVIGLPNNLSPFVAAGIMAGAATPSEIGPSLHRILYDEESRLQIERARNEYLARFSIRSDGCAAARSADAVLALMPGETAVPGVPQPGGRTTTEGKQS